MVSNSLPRKTDPALRARAEETLQKNPRALESLSRTDMQELIHELQVHQIELEIQNEELRRAQAELAVARDRFSDLYDFAPVGYLVLSDKNLILEANLTAATMLGVERAHLIKTPLTRFIARPDQDTFYHFRKQLAETHTREVCSLQMVTPQSEFAAMLEGIRARGADDAPTFRIILNDVTEHNRMENAVRANEERYRRLVEQSPVAIFINRANRIEYVNPAMLQLFDATTPEQLIGKSPYELFHPDYHAVIRERIAQVLQGHRVPLIEENILRLDGEIREVEVVASLFSDQNGPAMQVVLHDISARKRAEQALLESVQHLQQAHELLEMLTRGTNVSIAAVDLNFCFIYFNTAYAEEIRRLTGKQVHLGANLLELFAEMPEQQQVVRDEWSQPLRGETTNKTLEFGDPGRYRRFYNILHTPMRDGDGNVIGAGEVVRDVTELARAEQAQQENHATLTSFYDAVPMLMGVAELDGNKVVAISGNRATADFFATRPESLPGMTGDEQGASAELERVWLESYRQSQREGLPVRFEFEYPRAEGNRWLSATVSFIGIWSSGKPRFSFVAEDITNRKRTEEALRASEYRFRLALQNAPVSVAVQDRDLRYIWAYNQRTARPEEIIGHTDAEIFTPAEAAHFDQVKRHILAEDIKLDERMWLERPSGKIYLHIFWEPIHDDAGRVIGVGSATVNLTQLKLAEDALRASEEKARNLIQYAPAAIYEIDFQTRQFISVNDVVCEWTGHSREELLTMDPLNFADEATRTVLLNQLQRALAGEAIETATEARMIGRDGRARDLLLNIKTFVYQNGIPVSALVIAHDITERKRMEQAMREHAEELRVANEELVRFNRAAVGREWRMIELKQEVNVLCAQVGQPPRYSVEFTEDEQ